jgi:hypothetical protein
VNQWLMISTTPLRRANQTVQPDGPQIALSMAHHTYLATLLDVPFLGYWGSPPPADMVAALRSF